MDIVDQVLRMVWDNMHEPVLVLVSADPQDPLSFRLVHANPAAERDVLSEASGVPGPGDLVVREACDRALRTGETQNVEGGLLPSPFSIDSDLAGSFALTARPCGRGMVVVIYRISAMPRTTCSNRNSRVELKSHFLGSLNHVLRTPLNGVSGSLHLLAGASDLTPNNRLLIDTALRCSNTLAVVLGNVLDLADGEAGQLLKQEEPFLLTDAVDAVFDAVAISAAEKNVELSFRLGADVPLAIVTDRPRFLQILLNLVDNAIDFNKEGGRASVSLQRVLPAAIHPLATSDDHVLLHIAVHDSGVGIKDDDLHRIFQPLEAIGSSAKTESGFAGLSLSVCRAFIVHMGGRIWAESAGVSSGANVVVELPVVVAGPNDTELLMAQQVERLRGRTALVLCDEDISHGTLGLRALRLLEHFGVEVVAASNPDQAAHAAANASFDFVIVDRDTLLDDTSLDNWLAKTPIHIRRAPHVAMIGSKTDPDVQAATVILPVPFLHGWSSRGILPAHPSLLCAACVHPWPSFQNAIGQAPILRTASPAPTVMHVLCVDDNHVNLLVLERLLVASAQPASAGAAPFPQNCSVTTVDSGSKAVAICQERIFDVILMDIIMPKMDGCTATILIHEDQQGRNQRTPVVAVSASANIETRERCAEAGMIAFFPKPISKQQIALMLADILRSRVQRDI